MSPSQLNGNPAEARADIFALGLVIYEMACGTRRTARAEVQLSHVRGPGGINHLNMLPDFTNNWELAVTVFLMPITILWWSVWYPGAEPGGGSYIAQRMLASKSEKDALGGTLLAGSAPLCNSAEAASVHIDAPVVDRVVVQEITDGSHDIFLRGAELPGLSVQRVGPAASAGLLG